MKLNFNQIETLIVENFSSEAAYWGNNLTVDLVDALTGDVEHTINVYLVSSKFFGKLNGIGVHVKPESESDIIDAVSSAERDLFPAIYVYAA